MFKLFIINIQYLISNLVNLLPIEILKAMRLWLFGFEISSKIIFFICVIVQILPIYYYLLHLYVKFTKYCKNNTHNA